MLSTELSVAPPGTPGPARRRRWIRGAWVAAGLAGLAGLVAVAALPWEWSFIDDTGGREILHEQQDRHGTAAGVWHAVEVWYLLDLTWGLFRPSWWLYAGVLYLLPVGPAHRDVPGRRVVQGAVRLAARGVRHGAAAPARYTVVGCALCGARRRYPRRRRAVRPYRQLHRRVRARRGACRRRRADRRRTVRPARGGTRRRGAGAAGPGTAVAVAGRPDRAGAAARRAGLPGQPAAVADRRALRQPVPVPDRRRYRAHPRARCPAGATLVDRGRARRRRGRRAGRAAGRRAVRVPQRGHHDGPARLRAGAARRGGGGVQPAGGVGPAQRDHPIPPPGHPYPDRAHPQRRPGPGAGLLHLAARLRPRYPRPARRSGDLPHAPGHRVPDAVKPAPAGAGLRCRAAQPSKTPASTRRFSVAAQPSPR